MTAVAQVAAFLESFAPPALAEEWDNVGLLVGDRDALVTRAMTCLTITAASAAEAIAEGAELIVAHHPLPFRALKRITTDSAEGKLLWSLARAGVAIYSPHTAFDSAARGINQRLAEGLCLSDVGPLVGKPTVAGQTDTGAGRHGRLVPPLTLDALADRVRAFLRLDVVQVVGEGSRPIAGVAVACGSAGEFLTPAREMGCDCLVTGETRFHTCLEAEATHTGLILAGHFASERFGVEALADELAAAFPDLTVWPSRREKDPIRLRGAWPPSIS